MRGFQRIMSIGVVLGALLTGMGAGIAVATDPGHLAGNITDESNVLDASQEQALEEQIAKLRDDSGVELFIAYVPDFTNPSDDVAWVEQTRDANNMSDSQYLIGIATDGGMFAMAGPPSDGKISFSQQTDVTDAMLPALRNADWNGAVLAAVAETRDLLIDGPARAAQAGMVTFIVIAIIAALVIVFFVIRAIRKRRAAEAAKEAKIQTLARDAGSALVAADDAVKSSRQELDFARAQFGDEITAEYQGVLDAAEQQLNEAFALKQKLDDENPDSDAERESWNAKIIELCTAATTALEAKKGQFDELRKLEENAPAALENVKRLRAAAGAEIDRADQILAQLAGVYVANVLSTVKDNPAQARSRMTFTDQRIAEAADAIAAGKTGPAALSIRAAEGAVQQATQLEDAVEALAKNLTDGEAKAAALVTELQNDLATAAQLPDSTGDVSVAMGQTKQSIAHAQSLMSAAQRDPLGALALLEAANTQIDGVVSQVRDREAKVQRARAMLDSMLTRARTQVSRAHDYELNRRGGIGDSARTRLAEARASLSRAEALRDSDPEGALREAQRAEQLASQAIQLAQSDVDRWYGGGGGYGGGDDDSLGALLGGILIGNSMGGRRGGGGGFGGGGGIFGGGGGGIFGGGSSGSSGGFFGGGGGGGGGFSVGGFGGGGGGGGSRGSSGGRF